MYELKQWSSQGFRAKSMSAGTFPGVGWIRLTGVPPAPLPMGNRWTRWDQIIYLKFSRYLFMRQSVEKLTLEIVLPKALNHPWFKSALASRKNWFGGHTERVASNSNYIPSNLSLYSETILKHLSGNYEEALNEKTEFKTCYAVPLR
jgi:hypothetical protein